MAPTSSLQEQSFGSSKGSFYPLLLLSFHIMAKVYIVVEANWEYDDQYYTKHSGGKNHTVFMSKEKAEAQARRLNVLYLKSIDNIANYCSEGYEMDSIVEDGKYTRLAEILTGDPLAELDWDSCGLPKKMTQEQAEEIFDCLCIGWYDLQEMEAD